jgi:hypothetical protein
VNRRFGEMHHLHFQGRKSAEQSTSFYQVARKRLLTMKMELIRYFETSIHIRTTRLYIPQPQILQRNGTLYVSLE